MIYFDTAYLAKCYLKEPGYDVVRLRAREAKRVACCENGRVELVAVFHRHYREGRLNAGQFKIVFDQFLKDDVSGVWRWLPLTPRINESALVRFRDLQPSCFLRAADAIHLACAQAYGFREIFTNDRHLLGACEAFGLQGENLLAS